LNLMARARIHSIAATSIIGVVLFVSAGDLSWWPGWAYMIVLVASTTLSAMGPLRLDEGLIEERMSRKPDAKPWDRYFVGLVGLFTAAELIVPGLDHRWNWTPPQPIWTHSFGLVLAILGTIGLMWAMKANRFF
jgi:protein-S-isoprenylcysteine O-methyltransferase Ste14